MRVKNILIKKQTFVLLACVLGFFTSSYAKDQPPVVAIIIDDLGDNLQRGQQLIEMEPSLTYSFLPHRQYSQELATIAHQQGKEVMLHLPMQPQSRKDMGPGGLSNNMLQREFVETVRNSLSSVPYSVGVNNHMGSLLTRQKPAMQWLMKEIKARNSLYFVDSRTHYATVAAKTALENLIPYASRDVFLDHEINSVAIDRQFAILAKMAKRKGFALAIGHPHLETIAALQKWLPKLAQQNIEILPVSVFIETIESRRKIWQASLSLSPKVVKN